MFEERSQSEVDSLMKHSVEFRQLYFHHRELDKKVNVASLWIETVGQG